MPCLRPCSLGAGRQAAGVDKTVITDVDKRTQVLGGAASRAGRTGSGLGTEALGMDVPECPQGPPGDTCPEREGEDFTLGQSFVGLHVCS